MTKKRCTICAKTKPLSEFYVHKHMKDGHLNQCMQCVRDRTTARYQRIAAERQTLKRRRRRVP